MSIRETIARWVAPDLARNADRYHYLRGEVENCQRWLSEFPDVSDTAAWLLKSGQLYWSPIITSHPSIQGWREVLRARSKASITELEGATPLLTKTNTQKIIRIVKEAQRKGQL